MKQRRFEKVHEPRPDKVWALSDGSEAMRKGRSIFTSRVVHPDDSPRLLVSGVNNRKIGRMVTKGEWAGMPIYTLTLEERASCPPDCHIAGRCYGNAMNWARRHVHGTALELKLIDEVAAAAWKHPKGFVVRLHVLGDFYSVGYVRLWHELLTRIPRLRVFGYTARTVEHDPAIVGAIIAMNAAHPERCNIRFSDARPHPGGATVITYTPTTARVPEGLVCPAETQKATCCATCGLCWAKGARDETIVFILHGNPGRGKREAV